MAVPDAVKVVGGNILGIPSTTITAITALIGLVAIWIRLRPKMRELEIGEDSSMRRDLREDIKQLKEDHAAEKIDMTRRYDELAKKVDTLREQYDAKLEAKEASYRGEIAGLRHQLGNTRMIINGLINRIEVSGGDPEKLKEAVRLAREEASKFAESEATESGTRHGVTTALTQMISHAVPDPGAIVPAAPAVDPAAPAPARRRRRAPRTPQP